MTTIQRRVLLVDDQSAWLKIHERALEQAGFLSRCFSDPEEALKEIAKSPLEFPLIILDINLGKHQKNGVKIARSVFDLNASAHVYLISSQGQLKNHERDLEEIAEKYSLNYVRKRADEEGGDQVVRLARQHLIAQSSSTPEALPAEDAADLIWRASSEEEAQSDT